jgi:ribosomal RNA-processing protein 12
VEGCEGDFVQINDAVGTAFKRIVGECIDSSMVQAAVGGSSSSGASSAGSFVTIMVEALEEVMQIKYKTAWLHVLGAARKLFEVLAQLGAPGSSPGDCVSPLISQLAGIYQLVEAGSFTVDASTHLALGETLGAALRACGFVSFLEIVPLRASSSTPEYLAIDEAREWLLPLLHSNLKLMRCNLSDFAVIVLPMIGACKEAAANPTEYQLSTSQAALVKVRVMQLFSLFPDFCHRNPADLTTFLPRIMPELVETLKAEGKDALNNAQHILTGMAQLANTVHAASGGTVYKSSSTNEGTDELMLGGGDDGALAPPGQGRADFRRIETPDYMVVNKQANTALPAILTFLERIRIGDPSFASAVRCVSAWASVSPAPLVTAISKKLMQLLLQSTAPSLAVGSNSGDAAASWMSITLAMVPHLPVPMVHILYKTIKPLLSVNESISSQKRAYSILEAVLRLHGAQLFQLEPQAGILSVVSESLMSAHVSARSMRLRCIEIILASICFAGTTAASEEDKAAAYTALLGAADAVYGEALICHKDANQRTRDAAKAVLSLFVDNLTVQDSLMRLCAAIVAETASMRSAATLGLCMLCLKHRSTELITTSMPELMETTCLLLSEESAELTRAVLTFLKVGCAVLPQHCLHPLLPRILSASCVELGPLKSKFSTRCKGIMRKLLQRVGEESLRPHVPASDVPLLDYLLREGRRKDRKVQQNSGKDLLDSDDDVDDGDDGDDDGDDGEDEAMDIVQATSAKRYANMRSDHRISARPKAVRLGDAVDNRLPSSLTDLLEDQNASSRVPSSGTAATTAGYDNSRQSRKRGREEDEEDAGESATGAAGATDGGIGAMDEEYIKDGEKYRVVFENGVLVIKEKEEGDEDDLDARATKKGRKSADAAAIEAPERFKAEKESKKPRATMPGEEYKSKKSGGDVWRKGELEPHAYIPLDAKMLAGRNAREAMQKFGGVVDSNAKSKRARMAVAVASAKGHVVVGNRKQREARSKHKRNKGK